MTCPRCVDWADRRRQALARPGGDGWRFDVAVLDHASVPCRPDGTAIKQSHPDAFLFGEMIAGDFAGLVRDTSLDSATAYELFKAIWSSLNDANMWELAWALQRHAALAAQFRR